MVIENIQSPDALKCVAPTPILDGVVEKRGNRLVFCSTFFQDKARDLGHGNDRLAFRHFDIELPQSIGDRAGCAVAQNVAIDFNDG